VRPSRLPTTKGGKRSAFSPGYKKTGVAKARHFSALELGGGGKGIEKAYVPGKKKSVISNQSGQESAIIAAATPDALNKKAIQPPSSLRGVTSAYQD